MQKTQSTGSRQSLIGLNPKLVQAMRQQSNYGNGHQASSDDLNSAYGTRTSSKQNTGSSNLASKKDYIRSNRQQQSNNNNKHGLDGSQHVDYSLAMSQIVHGADVSAEGLDEDERKIWQEMTDKVGKEQVELNQVLNTAIAQHATSKSTSTNDDDLFNHNKIGYSCELSRLEPEPNTESNIDYVTLAS